MTDYAAIFEKTFTGWSAYCADLPGLDVATSTYAAEELLRQRITFHIDGITAEGYPIPEPATRAAQMPVWA